jgi:transposase
MLRAIKYELKPNKSQQTLIKKTCGCVRLIYNISLNRKNHEYETNGSSLSGYDLMNEMTKLKKQKEYEFLKEVPSESLQQTILNLDQAFKNFFKNKQHFGLPKFKKKGIKDSVLYIAAKQWNPGGSVDSTMFLEDRLHMNLNGYHLLDSCIASEIIRDYISRQSSTSKSYTD